MAYESEELPAPDELAHMLLVVLARLHIPAREHDMVRRTLGELTDAQYSVMQILAERGQVRISDLAQAEGVTLATMSVTVSRLARRGLVRRPTPVGTRRGLFVDLTARGAAAYRASATSRQVRLQALLDGLPTADLQVLTRSIGVLGRMVGERGDESRRIAAFISAH